MIFLWLTETLGLLWRSKAKFRLFPLDMGDYKGADSYTLTSTSFTAQETVRDENHFVLDFYMMSYDLGLPRIPIIK